MLREQLVPIDGVPMNYAEGPVSGPPLVLVHGLTGRWQGLSPLIPALTAAWHVFAYDLRGHGGSGRCGEHYRLNDYAGDLAAFLRHPVPAPAVVVGHSLGALAALAATPLAPERVRALVLLDPPLVGCLIGIAATPQFQQWFEWIRDVRERGLAREALAVQLQQRVPEAAPAQVAEAVDTLLQVDPATVRLALADKVFEGFDLRRTLRAIRCPLLVVRGEWQRGAAMRDEDAALVEACAPHATSRKLRAGHQLHLEHTETVLETIAAFLVEAGCAGTIRPDAARPAVDETPRDK